MKRWCVVISLLAAAIGFWVRAQQTPLTQGVASGAPVISAVSKGPDQINLTWLPVRNEIYGYIVEIRSTDDTRYANWTELQPIPKASGYTCDSSIVANAARCTISDPEGVHVYNPAVNGVPYWVTDATYIDPQDDSPAQFIAAGLRPKTAYTFRARAYTGSAPVAYGPFSNTVSATTAAYELRYVSLRGNDSNPGTAADPAHAWRTLGHGARSIGCGQALIVLGGDYANDAITMQQRCTPERKAVVMANPGDTPTITSMPTSGAWHPILILGSHIVIDGLRSVTSIPDYEVQVDGDRNALFQLDVHPPVVPSFKGGLYMSGSHNLVYRTAVHDYGSPDPGQNPGGNGGFVLTLQGNRATDNVIWSNHLTRGGHDVALCKRGCSYNRFLNNVMDGGWGMGYEAVGYGGGSDHNLIEGNTMVDVGKLVTFFKPSMELSGASNTVRRNVSINGASYGLEVSALAGSAANNLVYNNTFYAPAGCIFQSVTGGSAMYDHNVYANNICYKFSGLATDIYHANKTNRYTRNAIVA